ncbi:MAG: hypothetical protein PHN63_00885 [Candidatus Omnitrophica bacterium]|nr:hypothetical protein [Candidatus Omnitrophota bacterium]
MKNISGWRYGIAGIITLFAFMLVTRWQTLPIFLDSYYHAACMTGFRDAGGIVLHDFWEYAPAGRPHLYPPLFHIILLGLSKLGLPVLFIIRAVSVAAYPLLLFIISWVVTKLYNDRCAFFTVLAASMPYTFFLNATAAIPSTLALILLVLLFYAIETKRVLCGALLLGLAFYTHAGLSWITVLIVILYALFKIRDIKPIALMISGGLLLGSPWSIYMLSKRSCFLPANSYINNYFEPNALLYLFAIIGFLFVLKQRGRSLFYLAMIAGMMLMLKGYTFRFLCAEGLLPVIFLAGIGIDGSYSMAAGFLKKKNARAIVYSVFLPWLIFYLLTFWPGSSFKRFVHYDPDKATALESSIYFRNGMEELFSIIKANTSPDEIIFCNYSYVGGIFYTFTGRVSSGAMLNEVMPAYPQDPFMPAALIVWIKNPEGVFEPGLRANIDRLGLVKAAETELAYVYRNPVIMAHKKAARPVLPAGIALLLAFAWISAIFICITKPHRI